MSNDSKPQPTGWVAVDFDDPQRTFWGMNGWTDLAGVIPFSSQIGARSGSCRVFPWPVPQAVIAMLQHGHPTVDWSQVPVADAPAVAELRAEVEKLTRERDEARAELAKARLSRLDEFAKAALTGLCSTIVWDDYDPTTFGSAATEIAQATIRAIDGAGGA